MTKPLYLDAGITWQVALDAGPALHLSAPGRARTLMPLSRLARVVSPCHAQWSTPALLACLAAGVPVLFQDRHGDTVAWCFGPRRRETTLGNLLREALDQPDGLDLIDRWRTAEARREMLAALRATGVTIGRLDPTDARARLCNQHRLRLGRPAGPWLRALQRSTSALVAQRLHDAVGDPSLIGYAVEGLHLGHAFSELMEWQLHAVMHCTPAHRLADAGDPGRFAAQALEHHGPRLLRSLGQLTGSLAHRLRAELH